MKPSKIKIKTDEEFEQGDTIRFTGSEIFQVIKAGPKEGENQEIYILPFPVPEEKTDRKLSDFDIWFKPCQKCGYDTGKSDKYFPWCWKCGSKIHRDFSKRALKK